MDFSKVKGLTIPEGVVTQITDAAGNVLWALSGGKVILEVEKITSDTYAGETTYTGEQFILLDIYPKTNGTVAVKYGGLTKTITDTSGAEEPNAQQVYFGTFNGLSDEVETPASGTLTIEGDCVAVGCSSYASSSKYNFRYYGVTAIRSFGNTSKIPDSAYEDPTYSDIKLTSVDIPASIKSIGNHAFSNRTHLKSATIADGVESIGSRAFLASALTEIFIPASVNSIADNPFQVQGDNIIAVDSGNEFYKVDGNCLIEIATNKIISGFANSVIPSYVTAIGGLAFANQQAFTSITVPAQIKSIGDSAFWISTLKNVTVLATTPPTATGEYIFYTDPLTITVPKGCGAAYKAASVWSQYADYIVEES